MFTQLTPKIIYKLLSVLISTGLLSSCVGSVYIGADQPELNTHTASSQTYIVQEYPIYTAYGTKYQLSAHHFNTHIKSLKVKKRSIREDARKGKLSKKQARIVKRETHRSLRALRHLKRIEKKLEKRTKLSVRADLKAIRAQAKLDKIRRKAGIRTVPIFQSYPNLYNRNSR